MRKKTPSTGSGTKPAASAKRTAKGPKVLKITTKKAFSERVRLTAIKTKTKRLTQFHKHHVAPLIVKKLKSATMGGGIVTCYEIRNSLNKNHGIKLCPGHIRDLLHYIRVHGLFPLLLAASNGYFKAKTTAQVTAYLKSLRGRQRQIGRLAKAIDEQSHTIMGKQTAAKKLRRAA